MVGWSVRQKTFKPVGNGSATFHNVWLKWEEQLCHFRTRSRAACPDLSSSHHFQQRSHTYYQQCKPNQVHILTKVHFFSLSSTGNYENIKSNLFMPIKFIEHSSQKDLHKKSIYINKTLCYTFLPFVILIQWVTHGTTSPTSPFCMHALASK